MYTYTQPLPLISGWLSLIYNCTFFPRPQAEGSINSPSWLTDESPLVSGEWESRGFLRETGREVSRTGGRTLSSPHSYWPDPNPHCPDGDLSRPVFIIFMALSIKTEVQGASCSPGSLTRPVALLGWTSAPISLRHCSYWCYDHSQTDKPCLF